MQHRLAFQAAQIQREALLVAIEAVKKFAVARREEVRAHRARHVAAIVGVLDLDHFGALVGEEHRTERARPVLLDRQHADTVQRQHGGELTQDAA